MSNIHSSETISLLSLGASDGGVSKDSKTLTPEEEKEFLNSLLAAIDKKDKNSKLPSKDDKNSKLNEQKISSEESKELNTKELLKNLESTALMQILSLLEVLQSDTKDIKLNKLAIEHSSIVNIEKNLHKLKKISNIKELFDIAKEFGLNIKNIKFEQIRELKENFPNLDKKGFFEPLKQDNVFRELINQKISNYIKEDFKDKNNVVDNKTLKTHKIIENTSLLSSALKAIDVTKKGDVKIKNEDKDTLQTKTLNFGEKISLEKDKDIDLKIVKNDEKILDIQHTKNNPSIKNSQNAQEIDEVQNVNLAQTIKIKEQEKKDNVKLTLGENKSDEFSFSQKISSIMSETKEVKNNIMHPKTQNQNLDNKINLENLLNLNNKSNQNIKNEIINNTSHFMDFLKNNTEKPKDDVLGEENLNSALKDMSRISNNFVKNQNIPIKETFNDFAQEFKDKVQSYKAPITKFSITLNPSNLGEVEVTLIQRGQNLNVSFNSNQNALNLFIQHQAEFKNALVNMGFTNLEMNFNNQERKEQNNPQKNKNNQNKEDKINYKQETQEKVSLEMVLAKYF